MKKIGLGIFNKAKRSTKSNDEIILGFLRKVEKAVPPSTIIFATGLSPAKVSQRLKQLLKYKKIRVFYRKLPLYSINGDRNENTRA
jgi:predicted transcriptional regulator